MNGKTIEDIAELLGCSVGTVSRAINNRKGVSEKTRQHILKTMEEVGYQPNAIAQSLTLRQTHSIGVIVPDISHNFLGSVALAIEEELSKHKYDMLLFNTNWDPGIERKKLLPEKKGKHKNRIFETQKQTENETHGEKQKKAGFLQKETNSLSNEPERQEQEKDRDEGQMTVTVVFIVLSGLSGMLYWVKHRQKVQI